MMICVQFASSSRSSAAGTVAGDAEGEPVVDEAAADAARAVNVELSLIGCPSADVTRHVTV